MNRFSSGCALALALAPSLFADTASPGYAIVSEAAPPAGVSSSAAILSNGNFVTFDGVSVDLFDASGLLIQNLGTTGAASAFASFVIVDPTESFAVMGESSTNRLWKADLSGGSFEDMGEIIFNFAATFETSNTVIVSAATNGFFNDNSLIRIDTDTFLQTPLGSAPGPSGPVAVDDAGTLFYAPQSDTFPTPAGTARIVTWSAAQLQGGMIDDLNWTVFASGLDGSSSLAIEPTFGSIFLAETVAGGTSNRILEFAKNGDLIGEVANGGMSSVSAIRFVARGGAGSFSAYQPSGGIDLVYRSSEFGVFDNLVVVEPVRPTLVVSGPGITTGAGRVDVSVSGADPAGFVKFWGGNAINLLPAEQANDFGFDFLAHSTILASELLPQTGSTLGATIGFFGRWNYALGGTATTSFQNRPVFAGDVALQGIIIDGQGRVRGTTPVVTN